MRQDDVTKFVTALDDRNMYYRRNRTPQVVIAVLLLCVLAAALTMEHEKNVNDANYHLASADERVIWNVDHIVSTDRKLSQKINEIINQNITAYMSTAEKVKVVHDYIVLHWSYDYDNYIQGTIPNDSYSPRGVLINGKAVCEGYSAAFKAFMDELEIPCKIIVGTSGQSIDGTENHAWNIVQVDGDWFQIDVTWDDPVPDSQGIVHYNYFLVPDSVMEEDHYWEHSEYPACTVESDSFVSLLGPVCQNGQEIENQLYSFYVNDADVYTIIVPESLISNYEELFPYVWKVEKRFHIQLPNTVSTQHYGSYSIYTLTIM